MKTINVTEKTGKVIGALAVEESDELMPMTTGGQSVRIRAAEVRETGRDAQGVKLSRPRSARSPASAAKSPTSEHGGAFPTGIPV